MATPLLSTNLLAGASAFLVCALCVAPRPVATSALQTAPSPDELAKRLQAHYDTVRDFTADFTHTYQGGTLHQTFNERGDVRVKKPGRMFWNYTSPDKKEFVSDGEKIYSYIKVDNVVYVTDLPSGTDASAAVLFLAGRGNLVRDFVAATPAVEPDNEWQLDLTPKTPQADFSTLSLVVDRTTLALRGMTSVDDLGGTSAFRFTNLRENVRLDDSVFTFKMPKGVEVRR